METFDQIKNLHIKLLVEISDNMGSEGTVEHDNFVAHMKNFVPKGLLSRSKTMHNKLELLSSRGIISPGEYTKLKRIAQDSKNMEVLNIIEETERQIEKIREKASVKAPVQESASSSTNEGTIQHNNTNKKRKLEDDSDPLYQSDSWGRSSYDSRGKKGYLLILNSIENRAGTTADVEKLKEFFEEELGFEVDDPRALEKDDLTTEQLQECLNATKSRLNDTIGKKYYCFICAILAHGDEKGVNTKDGIVSIEAIRHDFNNKNIPNFAGRPKVFLIQACRGLDFQGSVDVDEADDNTMNREDNDASDAVVNVPTDADTLMAFATTPGFRSFRRTSGSVVGSWFITECINVFKDCRKKDHLEDMLVTVRERVAEKWQTSGGAKQMPCVWSTLTKRLFLHKN